MSYAVASVASEQPAELSGMLRFVTRWRVVLATQLIDVFIIILVALLLYPLSGNALASMPSRYLYSSFFAAFICHFSFSQGQAYEIDVLLNETRGIRAIFVRWSLLFLGAAALVALTRQPGLYSRMWFASYYACGFMALSAARVLVAIAIRAAIRRGFVARSVVLVGHNQLSEELISRLEHNRAGIRVVGVFDDAPPGSATALRGVPTLGNVADLINFSLAKTVDLVVITLPMTAVEALNDTVSRLRVHPLSIRVLPGQIGLDPISSLKFSRNDLPGVQLISVSDRPISELALIAKGGFDRLFAALLLLLLSPLLFCIAIGIAASSPGPVFFKQARVGFKGANFRIFKFRTMEYEFTGSYTPTRRNDNRIFRFGAFLRKSSLDELPQLINVLKGDMSLVGPRPHMVGQTVNGQLFNDAVDEYAARHRVKPGITGWAQINGWRGPTDTIEKVERRVEHDIYYIENWSLLFDFVILLKTPFVGLFGDNAF